MANDGKLHLPGGMGGLVRYDEEYKSKFMVSPGQVIAFIVIIILVILGLKIFLPITG